MKAPNPVSIPQIAIRGPAGTPKRFSTEAKSAALAAFSDLPFAAIAAPPRFAINASSDSLKLFWPRSAAMVPDEYLVAINAEIAFGPEPLVRASPAKTLFHASNPAPVLPHGAACAELAIIWSATAHNAAPPKNFRRETIFAAQAGMSTIGSPSGDVTAS